ncbi:MAG: ABC transporter permease, partial [Pseudomonadota bacterium]
MLNQIVQITLINLLSLPSRMGTTLIMLVSVAGIVAVITGTLSVATGVADEFRNTAREDRAVILTENVTYVGQSRISKDQFNAVANAPGIAISDQGVPAVTWDARVTVVLKSVADDVSRAMIVRGFSPNAQDVRPEIKLLRGRMHQPGLYEGIIGDIAQRQFKGTDIGDEITLIDNTRVQIVGVFESGDWVESGLVMDGETLIGIFGGPSSAVNVRLTDPSALDMLKAALTDQPEFTLQVVSESAYYDRLIEGWSLFRKLALFIGSLLALAGFFCTFNVMYSAVSQRAVEIATYKALGFGSGGVVISVVMEAVV